MGQNNANLPVFHFPQSSSYLNARKEENDSSLPCPCLYLPSLKLARDITRQTETRKGEPICSVASVACAQRW
ncbi:unnamed protein product [Ilex paraguariensis]|uniref:Uncharacterized protein n=1 Tax=Ilex paraguariensis TaxID=185542 RepID=A0ABC8S8F5_9AQUA